MIKNFCRIKILILFLFIFQFIEIHSQSIVGKYSFKNPLVMEGYGLYILDIGEYEYSYGENGFTIQEKGIWKVDGDTLKLKKITASIDLDCTPYSDSLCSLKKREYLNCIDQSKKFLILKNHQSLKKSGGIEKRQYYPHQWNRYVFIGTFSRKRARINCTVKRFVTKKDRIYLKALFPYNGTNILM
jgi:hypothetical protein